MNRRTTYDSEIKTIHAAKSHKKPRVYENPILNLTDIEQKRAHAVSSVKYRDDLLKHQQRSNYINEYDRLKGEIERRRVRGLQSVTLKNRQSDLKQLAKQSLNEPIHDIYKK